MNFTVKEVLDDASRKHPNKIAFVADRRELSYKDLESLVAKTASGLVETGITRHDKVAILSPNTLDWFVIQLATAELGVVLVPINTRFKRAEVEYILRQSDASLLLVDERSTGETAYLQVLRQLFPELQETNYQRIASDRFPHMKCIVGAWGSKRLIDTLISLSQTSAGAYALRSEAMDIVLMQYTSGTTSFPKGVMLSQEQILRNAFNLGSRVGMNSDDLLVSPLPFSHVGGSVLTNLLAITHGAGILTLAKYDPDALLALIKKFEPTAINGIDSHFIDIYTNPSFKEVELASVKKGWMIGTPEVVRHVIEDMGISSITNVYGLSEASPNVTSSLPTDSADLRCNTQGVTYEGMELRIVDPRTAIVLPAGSIGEIHVRGYSVMKGYYNKPDETSAVIDADGWLHTGDQGFLDNLGYLSFIGRMKDVIRVGGENVSAVEVENLLLTYPKIKRAAVIGFPDKRLGEVCYAFVELRENCGAQPNEIIEFCRGVVASFKAPRAVQFMKTMPMTESGKIQKFKLKEMVLEPSARKQMSD